MRVNSQDSRWKGDDIGYTLLVGQDVFSVGHTHTHTPVLKLQLAVKPMMSRHSNCAFSV